jgi:two-component system chemotaxis response regulator CheY
VSYQVLVVEDSSSMRSLIASTIEALGDLDVMESDSGFEALKALPSQKFDLIITDINMPDIHGLELVSFIKKNPSYKAIPLIIVSTERGVKDRERGLALGAEEYLVKPFDPEQLQSLVARYLNLDKGKQAASQSRASNRGGKTAPGTR